MKKTVIIVTFIWVGFICAISFMESWLKFQAPGITTELGVGIGKLVFEALNKVEITFALFITVNLIVQKRRSLYFSYAFVLLLIIIALQTFWLLPALSERAMLITQHVELPTSKLHLLFIVLEIIKTICLFIYGIKLLNMKSNV